MKGSYIGKLPHHDPLHRILASDVLGRLGVQIADPTFRVFRLAASNEVYAYEEKHTHARVIGKFYGHTFGGDRVRAAARAEKEYADLQTLRGYGLVGCPHHVIQPLGLNRDLNCVILLEYYSGETLGAAIHDAIHQQDDTRLYSRLKALGYFLATQHNRTANGVTVDFNSDCRYLDHLVQQLRDRRRLRGEDAAALSWLRDQWRGRRAMWQDQQVWLHGDATPANFLFGGGLDVAAIDLERMKRGDRLFDVGRIAGELYHAFLHGTGDKSRAEPFIGHFLWEYCCHFPDRTAAFASITARAPYYMGMTLLRIARNDWISDAYCGTLVRHAKQLLHTN